MTNLSQVAVPDDGIDFLDLQKPDLLLRLDVINGETAQRTALAAGGLADVAAVVEAVNAVFTEVWLELKPLVGGPFVTPYITVSNLMVPRTITL